MSEPYVHPRQPDYDSWPHDPDSDIFERKRELLDGIQSRHNRGELTPWDFDYLFQKSENFWQLFHFTSNLRVELETEIFARDLEIDNLKQQLKDALER
jgi:hypothetical protein